MIFTFGQYKVDIDIERTKAFYDAALPVSEYCSCAGCRNFVKAVDTLPREITSVFEMLGADMRKTVEAAAYDAPSEDTVLYGGFCHLCGVLLEGKSAWVPTKGFENGFHQDETLTCQITENFQISFENDCHLIEKDFPEPILQMEFLLYAPWVLPEKNPYK